MGTLNLRADTTAVSAFLGRLLAEVSQAPFEVRQLFVDRLEALPEPFCFDLDGGAAAGAGNGRIVLQPSDALIELVAALRAGELNDFVIKNGHGVSSGAVDGSEKAV
ncbi:MAG: hypothetical protein JSS57_04415 [Proteobacteria bacterium]|nr:hypothetical protein [Pseudomonadota bacterium]